MADLMRITVVAVCLASGAIAQSVPMRPPEAVQLLKADFVFDNAVRQTRDLPTAGLRALRRAMLAGGALGMADLRALADADVEQRRAREPAQRVDQVLVGDRVRPRITMPLRLTLVGSLPCPPLRGC